jgi:hypothetical protein
VATGTDNMSAPLQDVSQYSLLMEMLCVEIVSCCASVQRWVPIIEESSNKIINKGNIKAKRSSIQ